MDKVKCFLAFELFPFGRVSRTDGEIWVTALRQDLTGSDLFESGLYVSNLVVQFMGHQP